MSESEVGKLAVSIEKEMFNLYMNTDSKYKNKYRSLMFNLKDPKNKVGQQFYEFYQHYGFLKSLHDQVISMSAVIVYQGLFYRVIGGEVSPFRLVRLSPEELLSKEISDWRKTSTSEVILQQWGTCNGLRCTGTWLAAMYKL